MSFWTKVTDKPAPLPYIEAYRRLVEATRAIETAARALRLAPTNEIDTVTQNMQKARETYLAGNGAHPHP